MSFKSVLGKAVPQEQDIRRSSAYRIKRHQQRTPKDRYPNKGVCSRTGTKCKRPFCAAIGIGRYVLNCELPAELSFTSSDCKGDLYIW